MRLGNTLWTLAGRASQPTAGILLAVALLASSTLAHVWPVRQLLNDAELVWGPMSLEKPSEAGPSTFKLRLFPKGHQPADAPQIVVHSHYNNHDNAVVQLKTSKTDMIIYETEDGTVGMLDPGHELELHGDRFITNACVIVAAPAMNSEKVEAEIARVKHMIVGAWVEIQNDFINALDNLLNSERNRRKGAIAYVICKAARNVLLWREQ